MDRIIAIDPGNIESAYVLIDVDTYKPVEFDKVKNEDVKVFLKETIAKEMANGNNIDVAIEMIGHYGSGMPAGKSVFDTCVWIGRFEEVISTMPGVSTTRIMRAEEKLNLCGQQRAKDANIIQALIDRFAPDVPNRGKGSKKEQGFFYGFRADIWQAFAVGVTYIDLYKTENEEAGR